MYDENEVSHASDTVIMQRLGLHVETAVTKRKPANIVHKLPATLHPDCDSLYPSPKYITQRIPSEPWRRH